MAIVLLGTEACHLCELAQAIVIEAALPLNLPIYMEDITETPALLEQFGVRIPVLWNEQTQACLDWPFTSQEVADWLAQNAPLSNSNSAPVASE